VSRSLLPAFAGTLLIGLSSVGFAAVPPPDSPAARQEAQRLDQLPPVAPHGRATIDHSGRNQKGHVSYYSHRFAHRKMANGARMNPHANVAASKTLPLGTTATVTNLENGKSVEVKIEDRGPYVGGRVLDVSPKVANDLGIKHEGVAPVVVKPIAVPQPNGDVKLGAGAAEASPQEVRQATETTMALTTQRPSERAGVR